MVSKLSIMGLYLYDNSVFDNMETPVVNPSMFNMDSDELNNLTFDKNTFIDRLLIECADMSCIYTSPVTVKRMIEIWSKHYVNNWSRMLTAAAIKYVPIWNVDANIEINDSTNSSKTLENSGDDITTFNTTDDRDIVNSGTDTHRYNNVKDDKSVTNGGTDTTTYGKIQHFEPGTLVEEYFNQDATSRTEKTTTKIGAFNSAALSTQSEVDRVIPPKTTKNTSFGEGDKTSDSGSDTLAHGHTIRDINEKTGNETDEHGHRIDDTLSKTGTEKLTHGHSIEESEEGESTHTERRTGNIGVTASQDLVKKELEIAMFNIYDVVISSFKENFCVLVY